MLKLGVMVALTYKKGVTYVNAQRVDFVEAGEDGEGLALVRVGPTIIRTDISVDEVVRAIDEALMRGDRSSIL